MAEWLAQRQGFRDSHHSLVPNPCGRDQGFPLFPNPCGRGKYADVPFISESVYLQVDASM